MRLAALLLALPLAIVFCGLLWFASIWTKHQEDHSAEPEEEVNGM